MSQGTLTLTNNTPAVTGVSTNFIADLVAGDFIVFMISGTPYSAPVKSIESATELTLLANFRGPTTAGVPWSAIPQGAASVIPAQLGVEASNALRGLNLDKTNWQQVFSATDDEITVTLPDMTTYVGPSWTKVASDIAWLQDNQDKIEAAGGYADEAKAARDTALLAKASAESSKASAESSATTAVNAVNSIGTSVSEAQAAASTATTKAAAAATSATEAKGYADSINPALLMPKSGGTFTGPVTLPGDATAALNPVPKQQLDAHINLGQWYDWNNAVVSPLFTWHSAMSSIVGDLQIKVSKYEIRIKGIIKSSSAFPQNPELFRLKSLPFAGISRMVMPGMAVTNGATNASVFSATIDTTVVDSCRLTLQTSGQPTSYYIDALIVFRY